MTSAAALVLVCRLEGGIMLSNQEAMCYRTLHVDAIAAFVCRRVAHHGACHNVLDLGLSDVCSKDIIQPGVVKLPENAVLI